MKEEQIYNLKHEVFPEIHVKEESGIVKKEEDINCGYQNLPKIYFPFIENYSFYPFMFWPFDFYLVDMIILRELLYIPFHLSTNWGLTLGWYFVAHDELPEYVALSFKVPRSSELSR